jgi:hypothetical protein
MTLPILQMKQRLLTPAAGRLRPLALGGAARVLFLALSLSLAACGGASESSSANLSEQRQQAATDPTFLPSSDEPPSAQTIALQEEGGRLNQQELQAIAKTATLPPSTGGPSLSGASTQASRKAGGGSGAAAAAAVTKTAAYRFFNTRTGAHFYTTSTVERDDVLRRFPFMNLDGAAFDVSASALTVLSPVYRFYNTRTGVHFYTISEAEKQHIIANLKSFNFEGVAYHASVLPGTGYTPLYRFFLPSRGYHFYTASQQERDHIIANLRQYTYEGIAYYVLGQEWRMPAVPHSGVTALQCKAAGVSQLVPCDSSAARALSPKQDGHRAGINAMSYSWTDPSCIKDNVTGLLWEGKTTSGLRSVNNTYTNLGDRSASDASTYVAQVNASALCGFTDWRLPSLEELRGLVHFGSVGSTAIDSTAFPHTAASSYWTATNEWSTDAWAWTVSFAKEGFLRDSTTQKIGALPVRLVRGAPWSGQRYFVTSVAYPSPTLVVDAPDNAVVDRQTGLIWRRCLEGQQWTGSDCVGSPSLINHEAALAHSSTQQFAPQFLWRTPNVKELQTLVDPRRSEPSHDPVAFPGDSQRQDLWSSTPSENGASALSVWFRSSGETAVRSTRSYLRMVLDAQ